DATKSFKPLGKPLPLALRLTGKFKIAFPDGVKGDKDKPIAGTPALRESTNENSVILVADVDMLADGAAVDVQDVFGRKVVVPSNGNLAFALGMVEQFAAGDELISLRSRASAFRPLTVVRELEADALVFWTEVVNIAAMPVLVACSGIGVALIRRRRVRAA